MEIEIKFNETYKAPIGSPRPRFKKVGRYVQTYMPTSYTKHKTYIQEQKEQSYQPKVTRSREKTPEWLKNRNQEKETVDDDPEFEKERLAFMKQLEQDWSE